MEVYGMCSAAEFLKDRIVYRNLKPGDARLPGLEAILSTLNLPAGRIPRKHELMWIGDDPYMVIEVEYAVSEGFFGARSIEAAGVYVRRLDDQEQAAVARRLESPKKGEDQQPFRP